MRLCFLHFNDHKFCSSWEKCHLDHRTNSFKLFSLNEIKYIIYIIGFLCQCPAMDRAEVVPETSVLSDVCPWKQTQQECCVKQRGLSSDLSSVWVFSAASALCCRTIVVVGSIFVCRRIHHSRDPGNAWWMCPQKSTSLINWKPFEMQRRGFSVFYVRRFSVIRV